MRFSFFLLLFLVMWGCTWLLVCVVWCTLLELFYRHIPLNKQQSPELPQPVLLKVADSAETCSEIVSNKASTNYVALRRCRTPYVKYGSIFRQIECRIILTRSPSCYPEIWHGHLDNDILVLETTKDAGHSGLMFCLTKLSVTDSAYKASNGWLIMWK
jgi:hypothetical protein